MRSNAGMANRQGDVDLRFAQVPPPVRTLAWLGLAVSGTSRCLFSDKHKTFKYSVGRMYVYNSRMLNLVVHNVPSRL